ncbi:MAG: ATP synthase subunit I [Gallionella sp.]
MTVFKKIIRMPPLTEFAREKIAGVKIVVLQMLTALVISIIAYLISNSWSIASANLWGALTAALGGISLVAGLSKIEKIQSRQPHELLRAMYRNSMERFALVALFLFIAMGGLRLPPAAVLCGFVVGQAVPIVARILTIKR